MSSLSRRASNRIADLLQQHWGGGGQTLHEIMRIAPLTASARDSPAPSPSPPVLKVLDLRKGRSTWISLTHPCTTLAVSSGCECATLAVPSFPGRSLTRPCGFLWLLIEAGRSARATHVVRTLPSYPEWARLWRTLAPLCAVFPAAGALYTSPRAPFTLCMNRGTFYVRDRRREFVLILPICSGLIRRRLLAELHEGTVP